MCISQQPTSPGSIPGGTTQSSNSFSLPCPPSGVGDTPSPLSLEGGAGGNPSSLPCPPSSLPCPPSSPVSGGDSPPSSSSSGVGDTPSPLSLEGGAGNTPPSGCPSSPVSGGANTPPSGVGGVRGNTPPSGCPSSLPSSGLSSSSAPLSSSSSTSSESSSGASFPLSHPMPSLSPSNPCGSEPDTSKFSGTPSSSQFNSGGGDGIHTSGYEGSQELSPPSSSSSSSSPSPTSSPPESPAKSQPMPSLSPSNPCGSGDSTLKFRKSTSSQFNSGGGDGIHTSGYDASHSLCTACPTPPPCPVCTTACVASGAAISSNESSTWPTGGDRDGIKLPDAVVISAVFFAVAATELPPS